MKTKKSAKIRPELKSVETGALGMGDAYAYAVKGLIFESPKESKDSWLGVSKQTIEAKDCCDRTHLRKKK